MLRILICLFCCFCSCWLCGQDDLQDPPDSSPLKIGLGMMGISYVGDLTVEEGSFFRYYPGGSLSLQFESKSGLKPMLMAGYGGFSEQVDVFPSTPPIGVEPNTFVETSVFFTDLRLQYFLRKRKSFQPYLSAGVGLLFFSPEDQDGNYLGENVFTRLEEEFEYNTTVASFPLTAGFLVRLNEIISLSADYTHRLTPTDYLDNIGLLGTKEGNDALRHLQVSVHFTLVPREEIILPPAPQGVEPPLEIVAFAPEESQIPNLEVPGSLPVGLPEDAANQKKLKALIAADLKRLHEKADHEEPESLIAPPRYLSERQALEDSAIAEERFLYYAVKPTDRLEAIARRYYCTPQKLIEINQLSGSSLEEVELLKIPDFFLPPSETPPSAEADSQQITVATDSLALSDVDGINWLALEKAALAREDYLFLLVSKEEHLADLARRYHIRLETILALNYLEEPHLKADTYLRLPKLGLFD
jgi:LysM repeat protein